MSSVLVSKDSGVLLLQLNRPEKLNAFNPEMHKLVRAALEQALDDARRGTGRPVVVDGPAGVGKTRPPRELRESAARAGVRVFTGGGSELEGEFPVGGGRQRF